MTCLCTSAHVHATRVTYAHTKHYVVKGVTLNITSCRTSNKLTQMSDSGFLMLLVRHDGLCDHMRNKNYQKYRPYLCIGLFAHYGMSYTPRLVRCCLLSTFRLHSLPPGCPSCRHLCREIRRGSCGSWFFRVTVPDSVYEWCGGGALVTSNTCSSFPSISRPSFLESTPSSP